VYKVTIMSILPCQFEAGELTGLVDIHRLQCYSGHGITCLGQLAETIHVH